jgi:hypothetical protein
MKRCDAGSEGFFGEIPETDQFIDVVDAHSYRDVPEDWSIVITDVRGSTAAIEAGRYKDVNALGACGIIALRNALPDVELPFVFGGDGATVLVPDSRRSAVVATLAGLRRLATEAFDLELRCGLVPVRELRAQGLRVRVARYRTSPHVTLAMLMGEGFVVAEQWVKDPVRGPQYSVPESGGRAVDLDGFECRWRPVPTHHGTMLSLLVQAVPEQSSEKPRIYREVLSRLQALLGDGAGAPVSVSALRVQGLLGDFSVEARARSGAAAGPDHDRARALARRKATIGRVLIATRTTAGGFDGRTYRDELVRNCDFRKFDETLRMVVDVSPEQHRAITDLLDGFRVQGEIVYGVHCSRSALVTCFVRAYEGDHVHFVDGSDGGYALAAKQLKAQLAARCRESLG